MSDRTVTVCPECDSTQIARRVRNLVPSRRWHCRECKARFRDPDRRLARTEQVRNGLAKQLLEMDPGEVNGR